MAYTDIDDPTQFFNTITWTGAGDTSARSFTGVGFQPDWVWHKCRTDTYNHHFYDAVRGAGNNSELIANLTVAEGGGSASEHGYLSSFDADGFSSANGTSGTGGNLGFNQNTETFVAWNWLAGGTAPTQTYTVKVVSDSGNKYRFDDFGTSAVTLDLQEGGTYTFDQSDSSNSGHPLRFSTTSNGTHGGGSEYTTGVTTSGTPGSSGAKTVITVAASAPTLYYYCTQHSAMGGQANTNSTFGSSNFSGSVQTKVSVNTTAGFSIVSYTGTGSVGTFGHGLGAKPNLMIQKKRSGSAAWTVYHDKVDANPSHKYLYLNSNAALADYTDHFNDTEPTSSVFTLGTDSSINGSSATNIMYCFTEKKGYSKFGSYKGNGSTNGATIVTGFKPAWIMVKPIDVTQNYQIHDLKRLGYNVKNYNLSSNSTATEAENDFMDILSNGFKIRRADVLNVSTEEYIYWAFAESPFVNSKGVPNNGR
tara:strand:- start:406 stop:1833 length:1428 start_codon:yes stop_codon:yes gene_type:complete